MKDLPDTVFVHPSSIHHGNFTIGEYSSLWAGSVIRADFEKITIGRFTNIQDNVTIHAAPGAPTRIGNNVTVAHNAVIHACTIEDDCMISMGAIIQDHAVVGRGSIVAAGAVILENRQIPPGSIVTGIPAKTRPGKPGQEMRIQANALSYAALARMYKNQMDVTSAELFMTVMEELKKPFRQGG